MNKYSRGEVANIVEAEGLGYAVMDYLSSAHIEDVYLAELWQEAYNALTKIDKLLEPYYKE